MKNSICATFQKLYLALKSAKRAITQNIKSLQYSKTADLKNWTKLNLFEFKVLILLKKWALILIQNTNGHK